MDEDRLACREFLQATERKDDVWIMLAGGCGYFGMNLAIYIFRDQVFVVDSGSTFAEQWRLGTDYMIPGVFPVLKKLGGVTAYLITHGHEDHIGSLPHFYRSFPAPIFATAWTRALIQNKFVQHGLKAEQHLVEAPLNSVHCFRHVQARWVPINHSIPMACGLLLDFNGKKIFHTGDFKFDKAPLLEPACDHQLLQEIGNKGVDLVLCDSTNAMSSGACPSEESVRSRLAELIASSPAATVITTFSSNAERLISIVEICAKLGKKVLLCGRGIDSCIEIAQNLEILHDHARTIVEFEQAALLDRKKLVILATGCQGEWNAALFRMSQGQFRSFELQAGDRVIFSSRFIPGNEKNIFELISVLEWQGIEVITARQDPLIHASGHAYADDIKSLIHLLRPKSFLPVHGTFSHLKANQALASSMQHIHTMDCLLGENGDIFRVSADRTEKAERLEFDMLFVDSGSLIPMSREKLRQRLKIGELGCAIISGVYDKEKDCWLKAIKIDLLGIPIPPPADEEEAWTQSLETQLAAQLSDLSRIHAPWKPAQINEQARVLLRRMFAQQLNKKPIVHPTIQVL